MFKRRLSVIGYQLSVLLFIALPSNLCLGDANDVAVPVIDGEWRQVAGNPDLGKYTTDKQQPVDFAIWQAADGTWQIWSCIRETAIGGHTRLFHRWEGKNITDANWQPMGIVMMSPANGLQAPYVIKHKNKYYMFYGDWKDIWLAESKDGKKFKDIKTLFNEGGEKVNTRDPMIIQTKDKWLCYYTACPNEKGYVFCRTSDDLKNWSDSVVVAYGGKGGNYWASSECPHVVEPTPGNYYLFRTHYYGPGAKTSVYYSKNPFYFGIDDDSHLVCSFNLAAPEIVKVGQQYYIAALNLNLDGIRIAKLKWQK
jgi:hypothetical protein